jgi:hypothetical protein
MRSSLIQTFSICLITIAARAPLAAGGFDLPGLNAADAAASAPAVPKALTPVPAVEPLPAQPVRDWTIMVYMNGKNDQTFPMRDDINEMETVGSGPNVNVVAQLGTIGTTARPWMVDRLLVRKDDNPYWISSESLERRDGADMGDWRELADFITWAKAKFPARKYMLIVSGHGSGWWAMGRPSPLEKGIAFDDQSGRHINTQGLRQALQRGGGVDVYASDACLMQMAEVAYEIRGQARYIAGSEDAEFSYDYRLLLEEFFSAGADSAPRDAALAVVKAYARAYPDGYRGNEATHSVLDASALDGLASRLDAWAAEALRGKDKKAVAQAIKEVKRFSSSDYMDLADFLRLAGAYARTPELRAASAAALDELSGRALLLNAASGPASAGAKGLSIWIPYSYLKTYDDLAFARDTRWDDFARSLVKHTYPN